MVPETRGIQWLYVCKVEVHIYRVPHSLLIFIIFIISIVYYIHIVCLLSLPITVKTLTSHSVSGNVGSFFSSISTLPLILESQSMLSVAPSNDGPAKNEQRVKELESKVDPNIVITWPTLIYKSRSSLPV